VYFLSTGIPRSIQLLLTTCVQLLTYVSIVRLTSCPSLRAHRSYF
jgi:hypothetical protein